MGGEYNYYTLHIALRVLFFWNSALEEMKIIIIIGIFGKKQHLIFSVAGGCFNAKFYPQTNMVRPK